VASAAFAQEPRSTAIYFWSASHENAEVITEGWRRKLNKLWKLCGPWKEKPKPRRCRHTFARILLQKHGVTVRDVAELLGNTEEMVRQHYSAWVVESQGFWLSAQFCDSFSSRGAFFFSASARVVFR